MAETTNFCNILHAYKLQDYDVEEWLSELWASKANADFKRLINEVPIIQRIKAQIESQYAA